MKKLLMGLSVVCVFFLSSCDTQNAVKFNDKLVAIQSEMLREINMSQIGNTKDVKKFEKVKNSAREKVEEIKALKAPSGGEAFKQAMIDDIQGVYDMYELSIKLMDPNLKEDEIQKLQKEVMALVVKIDQYDKKVLEEQRKFAREKNFELKR